MNRRTLLKGGIGALGALGLTATVAKVEAEDDLTDEEYERNLAWVKEHYGKPVEEVVFPEIYGNPVREIFDSSSAAWDMFEEYTGHPWNIKRGVLEWAWEHPEGFLMTRSYRGTSEHPHEGYIEASYVWGLYKPNNPLHRYARHEYFPVLLPAEDLERHLFEVDMEELGNMVEWWREYNAIS